MEMGDNKQICRLCLDIVPAGDAEAINEKRKEILEVLLINVDLHISDNAVACSRCMEELQSGFEFKSTCFNVDNCISMFVDDNVPVDIKKVFPGKIRSKAMENVNLEHRQICRLCMSIIDDEALECNVDLKAIITNCLPEVDIYTVYEPLVCELCYSRMKKLNEFMKTCQELERRINNYCQVTADHAIPVSVNLTDLLMFKDYTISKSIKDECDNFDRKILQDLKKEDAVNIECEEIHIKDELGSCEEMGESVPSGACNNFRKSCSLKRKRESRKSASKGRQHGCQEATIQTDRKYVSAQDRHKDKSEVVMQKCENCEYRTRHKSRVMQHMVKHRDPRAEREFKCDKCPFATAIKSSLRNHNLIHKAKSEVEMHKCEKCEYESRYKCALKAHVLIHKDNAEVPMHKCEKCEFETRYKKSIIGHMVRHRDPRAEREFKCDKCTYTTHIKSALGKHNLMHKDKSEVKMHKCESCDYETRYKCAMKTHYLVHKDKSEVEILKCDNCEYETRYKCNMIKHMLKHHNPNAERKF